MIHINNNKLQQIIKNLSKKKFKHTFQHYTYFNKKLHTTNKHYLLKSHNIKINPKQYKHYKKNTIIKIILHKLYHYHLHITNKNYQHKDQNFKQLNQQIKTPKFYNNIKNYQQQTNYKYYYTKYHTKYIHIHKINTNHIHYKHYNKKLKIKKQLK